MVKINSISLCTIFWTYPARFLWVMGGPLQNFEISLYNLFLIHVLQYLGSSYLMADRQKTGCLSCTSWSALRWLGFSYWSVKLFISYWSDIQTNRDYNFIYYDACRSVFFTFFRVFLSNSLCPLFPILRIRWHSIKVNFNSNRPP